MGRNSSVSRFLLWPVYFRRIYQVQTYLVLFSTHPTYFLFSSFPLRPIHCFSVFTPLSLTPHHQLSSFPPSFFFSNNLTFSYCFHWTFAKISKSPNSMVDIRSDMPSKLGLFVSTFAVLIGFKTPSREIGSRMRFQNQILYSNAHRDLSNDKYRGKNWPGACFTNNEWGLNLRKKFDNSQTLRA